MSTENIVKTNTGIAIRVSNKAIDNLMIAGMEIGISRWCKEVRVAGEYLSQYASEQIARGGGLLLYCKDKELGCYLLTKELFFLGVKIVFEEYNHFNEKWFKKIAPGVYEIDETTHTPDLADLIIQCGLWGEPVFTKKKEC